ncbi:hypothetical protein ASG92_23110 [Arthrobacter sp. Soil736]|uniref:glycoside hydrolase family 15 protein n=1 Tax=Arthrobacter sp. Soil736 TaxID=1736395 RepID=UPI0006F81AF0|nr:glycoside hydrolase family 15 protein [Arthrobacter sp. Soil736]KRE58549.1 hypothetical protein ASG92_23110 [Arthrobacter sp. Soil736]
MGDQGVRAAGHATDLGLLAQEVAPDSNDLLGNFPRAFSRIGLVNAAWAISTAAGFERFMTALAKTT